MPKASAQLRFRIAPQVSREGPSPLALGTIVPFLALEMVQYKGKERFFRSTYKLVNSMLLGALEDLLIFSLLGAVCSWWNDLVAPRSFRAHLAYQLDQKETRCTS